MTHDSPEFIYKTKYLKFQNLNWKDICSSSVSTPPFLRIRPLIGVYIWSHICLTEILKQEF